MLDSLSIGFQVPKNGSRIRKDGVREILTAGLREISVVVFPANVLARVAASKRRVMLKNVIAEMTAIKAAMERNRRKREQKERIRQLEGRFEALRKLERHGKPIDRTHTAVSRPCRAAEFEERQQRLRDERARQRRAEAERFHRLRAGI